MKTILASQNAHKAEEFAAAIHSIEVNPAEHGVDVDENETTFIGNARLKARAYAREFKQNALADDSGLCVDALDGKPGIYSQRFAILPPDIDEDEDRTAANNRKLLRCLANVPDEKRGAHFSCALCLVVVEKSDIETLKRLVGKKLPETAEIHFFDADDEETGVNCPDIVRAELTLEGQSHGRILHEKRGECGFGYDPLFFSPEAGCTFAELSKMQKLSVSHRGRAIAMLREILE